MKRFSIITGILSGLLFGVATPFSKFLLEGLNSFQLAGLLYLGAAIAMFPYIFRKDSNIKLLFQTGNRGKTLGIIFFGGLIAPLFLLAGLKTANAASVSIWLNMELVATAIIGLLIFKEKLDRNTWIGVALTLMAGVVSSFGQGPSGITSALLITAACICWALDNHLTALTDGASPQTVTFIKGIFAGSVNFLIGCLISSESVKFGNISLAIVAGVFSYGVSIVLYVISSQNVGATRGQILFSTAPVWGVVFSYLIFRDSFLWVHVISIVLLTFAILMIYRSTHTHSHSHPALEHIHYHQHNDEHHFHSHENENVSGGKWHLHEHTHEPLTHEHSHYPDLHHRHDH
ncbi:MAG: EamA family transporter [Bacteroidales bacterium]|jgi:drug/metabolite transporter (DMT)-like permease